MIALWLGHESSETTQIYWHADMQLKERALAHANESGLVPTRYKPPDLLLEFLERLDYADNLADQKHELARKEDSMQP